MGLMSRFIVKTNHMIVRANADESSTGHRGVYWHNGVFLQSGEGPLLSQALCQFNVESRTLSIEVRAAFPQKLLDQIDAYVQAQSLLSSRGSSPCAPTAASRVDEDSQVEMQCPRPSRRTEDIFFALQSARKSLSCARRTASKSIPPD
jgi:hypothetical protein